MNMSAVIAAGIFLFVSIVVLVYLFIGKGPLASDKNRLFYLAACGVYASGALLVLFFTLIMPGLPVAFVIISDVTVLAVFIFTCGLIYFTSKTMLQMAEKAKADKNDEIKENNENDEHK